MSLALSGNGGCRTRDGGQDGYLRDLPSISQFRRHALRQEPGSILPRLLHNGLTSAYRRPGS